MKRPDIGSAAPAKRRPPFEFVIEALDALHPVTRPMFGCYGVYLGPRIVFILRHKPDNPEVNGVWFATTREHHPSLKLEFPSLGSVTVLGAGETNWQMIHETEPDFEESVLRACELVLHGDKRIGHIPARKKRRAKAAGRSKKSATTKPKRP